MNIFSRSRGLEFSLSKGMDVGAAWEPARRANDYAATRLGKLHRGEPDAAAGAVDEARFARMRAR